MRKLISALAIAVIGLAACGSDDSKSGTGGLGTGTGTGTGTDAGTGTGTGTGTDTGTGIPAGCNAPACYANLMANCIEPSGTCVEQSSSTTMSSNICYSNGVKIITVVDSSGMVTTYKNGSKVCFSMVVDISSIVGALGGTGATTMTLKNGSGATVATMSYDSTGQGSVTCAGGAPVVLNEACKSDPLAAAGSGGSGQGDCTAGACTP